MLIRLNDAFTHLDPNTLMFISGQHPPDEIDAKYYEATSLELVSMNRREEGETPWLRVVHRANLTHDRSPLSLWGTFQVSVEEVMKYVPRVFGSHPPSTSSMS
jgi:hypothetical protein